MPNPMTEPKDEKLLAAADVIDFCAGAIMDAIYTEDGLDGSVGENVLQMVAEWKKYGTFDKTIVERSEMLRIFGINEKESE
jgi:hypothetical protein